MNIEMRIKESVSPYFLLHLLWPWQTNGGHSQWGRAQVRGSARKVGLRSCPANLLHIYTPLKGSDDSYHNSSALLLLSSHSTSPLYPQSPQNSHSPPFALIANIISLGTRITSRPLDHIATAIWSTHRLPSHSWRKAPLHSIGHQQRQKILTK